MSREERLLALVAPALAEADRNSAVAIERDRKRGLTPSCRKGCTACCHYLARISIAEALHIRNVVAALPDDHRERVLSRAGKIREVLDEAGLTDDFESRLVLEPGDFGEPARLESLSQRYLALGLACPFLENDACSIYEDRPTPCRQYLVTTPAELCAAPFTTNIHQVQVGPLVRDRLMLECAEITGDPPRMVPLAWLDEQENHQ